MPRMIADPAFLYKLLLEQAATIGLAVSWELKNRKDRFFFFCMLPLHQRITHYILTKNLDSFISCFPFCIYRIKKEWDLALVNVLTASLCNALVVWALAPCRSYGNTFRFNLQNTLQKLPNNIFERSYPLREFDLQKRIHSFCYKAAELCLVGLTAGTVQGSLSNLLAAKKQDRSGFFWRLIPISLYFSFKKAQKREMNLRKCPALNFLKLTGMYVS